MFQGKTQQQTFENDIFLDVNNFADFNTKLNLEDHCEVLFAHLRYEK